MFIQLPFVGVGPHEAGVAAGHMVPEAEWHSKRPTAARAYTNPPNTPGCNGRENNGSMESKD